jgi:hypothetical protein
MSEILLQPEDAGRQLYAERPLPSWWALAVVVLALLAVYALLLRLFDSTLGAAATTAGAALFVALLFGTAMLDQHRVCERALLLGPTLPRALPYVVPLTTIDPASVRLHHRANFITRRLRQQGTPNLRMAPFATVAVSFTGLHPSAAHPRRRAEAASLYTEPLLAYENTAFTRVVTERWVLATRHPDRLLRALEQALDGAGLPGAAGLAERELRNPIVERWRRDPGASDPTS